MTYLVLLQVMTTLPLVGLIWFVQIVHYPLFLAVGESDTYYQDHQSRASMVVIPLMLGELMSTIGLLIVRFQLSDFIGMILLTVIWMSTAYRQVPCHRSLARGYDEKVARRLVHGNWVRTLSWTARGVIVVWGF
jgi:hypothetical protein